MVGSAYITYISRAAYMLHTGRAAYIAYIPHMVGMIKSSYIIGTYAYTTYGRYGQIFVYGRYLRT